MAQIDTEREKKEILQAYKDLLKVAKHAKKDAATKKRIRKAFDIAVEAHKNDRRKSGEPYIFHPIAVARICAEEIGLGATSIICALLHDTVEDTDITIEEVEKLFGKKEALIIDGLTKISGVVDNNVSLQAENFRKVLLTLSEDVRVILIKIADRLHNMRTIDSMRRDKQLKIASETLFLYAPLAHRLGLHSIKSELEDLSFKCQEPEAFKELVSKLKKTQEVRERFITKFSLPIKKGLEEKGFKFEIKGRPKSIYSIWNKMNKKNIPFEEVYDLFAIRIIIDTEKEENEKSDCWQVYSVVTDYYQPNIDRLRDWISAPKTNGYESLQTTVMSPTGKWVEVQIRTKRMDDIAEKGFAAHWKYKEGGVESQFDRWINQVRELLESTDTNALDLIDDFKMNLFTDEIYVFTPNGDMKNLPTGASALDFAFAVHTQVGITCLGAKVNNKLVPLSYQLNSGDQVEILTSNKQKPKEDWLNFVQTQKAKSRIKSALKDEKRIVAEEGKIILEKEFKKLKISYHNISLKELEAYYKVSSTLDLYYKIAINDIDLNHLKSFVVKKGVLRPKQTIQKRVKSYFGVSKSLKETPKKEVLVIGDNMEKLDYKLANCCNPIPGDEVYGFITVTEGIKIHKTSCPNTVQLMSNYAYRVIKAQWIDEQNIDFLTGLKIVGFDDVGVVNNITQVISNELHVNMRSLSFDSHDGIFEGRVMVFVKDTSHLTNLIKNLTKVKGVRNVDRINN
ncbi:MAG: RelA/SpoT family protein [Flavobacteriales bacterium CG_4_10_14_0_2_um_filter_32_8]|nr:MAG: RelA/SpoT family protein [Flavobacteriales bacterium CG_4_10_14_0_2_um_filter_32_8]PJB15812.1 MAG: RelA/SpoT family protein [Flavobacteriales bacterium CG_4_9_14_3_um_filter_32_8]